MLPGRVVIKQRSSTVPLRARSQITAKSPRLTPMVVAGEAVRSRQVENTVAPDADGLLNSATARILRQMATSLHNRCAKHPAGGPGNGTCPHFLAMQKK